MTESKNAMRYLLNAVLFTVLIFYFFPANSASNDACLSAQAEARLRRQDIAMLGYEHAMQHASSRTHQCRVLSGLEKLPSPQSNVITSNAPVTSSARPLPFSTIGKWSQPFVIPIAGVTAVLLHTGKVLFWSYDPDNFHVADHENTGVAYVWDPVTRTGHSIQPPENIWCAGQTILGDGRVYVAGGNLVNPPPGGFPSFNAWQGALGTYTFNPYTETWTKQPDMNHGRWYPTVTQLADNSAIIASGLDESGTSSLNFQVERFQPDADIDGVGQLQIVSNHPLYSVYPFQYLLPSGYMLQGATHHDRNAQLNPSNWSWSSIPDMLNDHFTYANGISYTDASVNPVKQLIMIAGGTNGTTTVSNNEWMDGFNPNSGWHPYPKWLKARHNSNTVILPDESLLTVGGNSAMSNYGQPLFENERYNKPAGDVTGRWEKMAPNSIQAAYHSTAILLPDATVLLSQDDNDNSAAAALNHQYQVYSPPYLFKGPRPVINNTVVKFNRGRSYIITTNSSNIGKIVLIAPGAVTHGNDMHQRLIKLNMQKVGRPNAFGVTIPVSSNLVPPGYYMLFVVNTFGVPSIAKFVHIS